MEALGIPRAFYFMKILFNLVSYKGMISSISLNDIGTAHAILTRICMENGLPVTPGFFDPNHSFKHNFIYDQIKGYAESLLTGLSTPEYAFLSDLGNLQFQLTLHY